MELNEYQELAARTSKRNNKQNQILIATLGLNGEAGELTETVKHWIGHKHELDIDNVAEEIGDILWYVADIASAFNLDLEDIGMHNIQKLQQRYPEGFSTQDSIERKDKK